jgi:hypothetical protein
MQYIVDKQKLEICMIHEIHEDRIKAGGRAKNLEDKPRHSVSPKPSTEDTFCEIGE